LKNDHDKRQARQIAAAAADANHAKALKALQDG